MALNKVEICGVNRHKGLAALCTPAPAKLAFTAEAVFASFTGSVSVHLRP